MREGSLAGALGQLPRQHTLPHSPGANPLTCETSQGTRRGPSLSGLCLLRAFSELRSLSWLKGGVGNAASIVLETLLLDLCWVFASEALFCGQVRGEELMCWWRGATLLTRCCRRKLPLSSG